MIKKFIIKNNNKNKLNSSKTNDFLNLVPKIGILNQIKYDFDGILVATVQYEEGPCGCTLIYFEKGAQIYIDKRGGSPAYLSVESNDDDNFMDGICIAGGSILGLEATCGVIAESLKLKQYKGFKKIAGSMLRSHNLDFNMIYPDKNLGRFALRNLRQGVISTGQVGAGLYASIGQGASYSQFDKGIKILAITSINSIGDIFFNGNVIKRKRFKLSKNLKDNSTTISVLITNLSLSSYKIEQIGKEVHTSMAEFIRPFHTIFDGDVFYCCSTNELKITDLSDHDIIDFGINCSKVMADAILKATK